MTENYSSFQLELLVPWDLPIEHQLSEANKAKISQAIKLLLQALNETSPEVALIAINEALTTLKTAEVSPAKVFMSKTSLQSWEVEDYDRYFEVNHVQAQEPATCIIRSVLVAYQTFLTLIQQSNCFDPAQVKLQKQGLISYARLLERVFQLNLGEPNE